MTQLDMTLDNFTNDRTDNEATEIWCALKESTQNPNNESEESILDEVEAHVPVMLKSMDDADK